MPTLPASQNSKPDYDLDAPSIEVTYMTKTADKADVKAEFEDLLQSKGFTLIAADQRKPRYERLKDKTGWLIEFNPEATGAKPPDFTQSAAFYKLCKKAGSKVCIVRDDFSYQRAEDLYPQLRELEVHFRRLIVSKGIDLRGYSGRKRDKISDHVISLLDTSELFGVLLFGSASESYYLRKLEAAQTNEERLQARNATRLDEFGFGQYKDFFRNLHNLRNKVMHFKVITAEEYTAAKEDIAGVNRRITSQDFQISFFKNYDHIIESARKAIEAIMNTAPAMQKIAESVTPSLEAINRIYMHNQAFASAFASAQKAAESAFRVYNTTNTSVPSKDKEPRMNVLFICAQNVGRSQMAAALFNKLHSAGHADSVGTTVEKPGQSLGDRATHSEGATHVLTVLDEEGIDARGSKRTPLTEGMISKYDYVVVMAERNTWPEYLIEGPKVIYWDIADPRFKGLEATRKTRDEIKQKVTAFIKQHGLS